jgi:MFS family permease
MQVARENGRDLPDFQLKPLTSSTRSAVMDILKPELRGTGMGAASGMTRIAGAIAPSLGGILFSSSFVVPLSVFALSYIVAGVAAFFLPDETSQQPLADALEA